MTVISQPTLSVGTTTRNVTIVGDAVSWVTPGQVNNLNIACAVLRMGDIPIRGAGVRNRYALDTKLLRESHLWLTDMTSISMTQGVLDTAYNWKITADAPVRTRRYGSLGVEALSGMSAGSSVGNILIDVNLTATQFLDLLVDAEKEKGGPASDLLEDWAKRRLSHLYAYASRTTDKLQLRACVTEVDSVFSLYSPMECSQLSTPTGVVLLPKGSPHTVTSLDTNIVLSKCLDVIDSYGVNSALTPDPINVINTTVGADANLQMGYVNGLLSSASKEYVEQTNIFGVGERDICLWYYLASMCFKQDTTLQQSINNLGHVNLADIFISTPSHQRYVPIIK